MRKKIIAANWKMYKIVPEVTEWLEKYTANPAVSTIVFPPSIYLSKCLDSKIANLSIGAQNTYYSHQGAFTGEISSYMLESLGVEWVLIGHSERRKYFQEDTVLLKEKLNDALYCNLKVIFCIGETLEQREKHQQYTVIEEQLEVLTAIYDKNKWENVVIAYEPVWAIGTGKNATPEEAQDMHLAIRNRIREITDASTAENISILYGGSVTPENIADIIKQEDVDGALVGGASLDITKFLTILQQV